jgi:hypothetical protein
VGDVSFAKPERTAHVLLAWLCPGGRASEWSQTGFESMNAAPNLQPVQCCAQPAACHRMAGGRLLLCVTCPWWSASVLPASLWQGVRQMVADELRQHCSSAHYLPLV